MKSQTVSMLKPLVRRKKKKQKQSELVEAEQSGVWGGRDQQRSSFSSELFAFSSVPSLNVEPSRRRGAECCVKS